MCVLEHLGVPLYTVEPAAMSTVPLAVLNRVLLHDLSTDWAALERFPPAPTSLAAPAVEEPAAADVEDTSTIDGASRCVVVPPCRVTMRRTQ